MVLGHVSQQDQAVLGVGQVALPTGHRVTHVQVLAVGEDLAAALEVAQEHLTLGCLPAERKG